MSFNKLLNILKENVYAIIEYFKYPIIFVIEVFALCLIVFLYISYSYIRIIYIAYRS